MPPAIAASAARAKHLGEWLAAYPQLETLVIPIGGGGPIAGMATVAKAITEEETRCKR